MWYYTILFFTVKCVCQCYFGIGFDDRSTRFPSPRRFAEQLCDALKIPKESRRFGVTKAFLKDDIFHKLESKRNRVLIQAARQIQTFYRYYSDGSKFLQMKQSLTIIQLMTKAYLNTTHDSQFSIKIRT